MATVCPAKIIPEIGAIAAKRFGPQPQLVNEITATGEPDGVDPQFVYGSPHCKPVQDGLGKAHVASVARLPTPLLTGSDRLDTPIPASKKPIREYADELLQVDRGPSYLNKKSALTCPTATVEIKHDWVSYVSLESFWQTDQQTSGQSAVVEKE